MLGGGEADGIEKIEMDCNDKRECLAIPPRHYGGEIVAKKLWGGEIVGMAPRAVYLEAHTVPPYCCWSRFLAETARSGLLTVPHS